MKPVAEAVPRFSAKVKLNVSGAALAKLLSTNSVINVMYFFHMSPLLGFETIISHFKPIYSSFISVI